MKTNGAAKYWKVAVICLVGGGAGQQSMKQETTEKLFHSCNAILSSAWIYEFAKYDFSIDNFFLEQYATVEY